MESEKSAKEKAIKALETVKDSCVILTNEDIVNYIVMFVDFVIAEISEKRILYITKENVVNEVMASVLIDSKNR